MQELVVLVDTNDNQIGTEEKLKAHQEGKLHRAFSVFIFNAKGEMMLQKRASHKYHTGGLWTNTCCSHPRPGEDVQAAAHRRLQEEMGFDCPIKKAFSFIYKVYFKENNLYEHEFDHVFIGYSEKNPQLNPEEAEDFAWVAIDKLKQDIKDHPEKYTYWFKVALDKVIEHIK